MGDSFLIRSIKKFFVIVYLFARVCAPRRMRPGVRVCVRARVCVCAREGCDICATLGGCGIYASLLQKGHTC